MLSKPFVASLTGLQDYVATCLVPAILLAGARVTFVRREAVLAVPVEVPWYEARV